MVPDYQASANRELPKMPGKYSCLILIFVIILVICILTYMAVQHGIKIDNQVHVQPTATSCPVNKCSKSSKNFEDAAVQTDYSNIDYKFRKIKKREEEAIIHPSV